MTQTFDDKDLVLLEQTMTLRSRMVANFARRKDEDLPMKPSDIMAVTSLLDSVDRSVFAKAKINIESSSAKNDEQTRLVLLQLMHDLHGRKEVIVADSGQPVGQIPVYQARSNMTINEGELIPLTDNFSPDP